MAKKKKKDLSRRSQAKAETKKEKDVKIQFADKLTALLTSGFGLVAALAWNDAIKSLFELIPFEKTEIWAKFIYAVLVTIIVVVFLYQFNRISEEIVAGIKRSKERRTLTKKK